MLPPIVIAASPEMPPLRVVEVDANHGKAFMMNMLVVVWTGTTTARAYQRIGELLQQLAGEHPLGVGVLQTVELGADPPDSSARQEFSRVLELCEKYVKHYSVVHEGNGFKAASVRAIMAGVYLLKRPSFPHVVMSSVADAAAWHASHERALGRRTLREEHIVETVRVLRNTVGQAR